MRRLSGTSRITPLVSSTWSRYGLSILVAAVAVLPWLLLGTHLQPSPLPLLLAAVMIVAWFVGTGPGLVALLLSLLCITLTYRPSSGVFPDLPLQIGVFTCISLGMIRLNGRHIRVGRALEQSQQRLAQVVDSSIIGVILSDLDGGIHDANDAFLRLVGYSRDDLAAGRVRWDVLTAPEHVADTAAVTEYLRIHGTHTPFEKEYVRKDGSRLPVLVGITMLAGSDREAVTFVLDLTERRQIEVERVAIMQQKDTFLLAVAHDLKTPLTTIKGHAQLLQQRLARTDTIDHDALQSGARTIERMSNRMVREIEDLLDVMGIEMGRSFELSYEPVDLVALVRDIAEDTESWGSRYRVHVDAEPQTLVAQIDRVRLARALCNLVDNALKYSPKGGNLTITVRPETGRKIWIRILDQGMGIPEDDVPHLFTPFYRGANVGPITGTGVGLAGVKQVIDQHGGTIDVRSREGKGTEVSICLPVDPPRDHGRPPLDIRIGPR